MGSSEGADDQLVLIVEDDPSIAELVQHVVEDEFGVRAVVADDGECGLKLARALKPAVVLLDINLPKMNGLEVVRRLKDDPGMRDVALVAMTATPDAETLGAGCSDHLAKPFDLDDLTSVVGCYLGYSSLVETASRRSQQLYRLLLVKATVVAGAARTRREAETLRALAEEQRALARSLIRASKRLERANRPAPTARRALSADQPAA